MASAAKAARQRRKEIAKKSKEAAKRRKQMLRESQLSDKAKSKKASKKEQQASGLRVALAKAFPTFASALKVKPADVSAGNQVRPKKDFVGRTPSVNLLPPEFTEDRQVASTRRSFSIAGIGVVGALSVVYFAQGAVTNIADDALFAAQTQGVETQQRTSQFADVTAIYDELGSRSDILDNIENNSPEYFAALTELYDLLPSGSSISNVNMSHIGMVINPQAEDETSQRIGTACGDPVDPFTQDLRPVSACLKFSGETNSIDSVFLIMEAYQGAQLLSNVVVERNGEVDNNGIVRFTGTAAVLAEADVTKVLGGIGDEYTGDVSFGDGSSGSEDSAAVEDVDFEPGTYTLTDDLSLVNTATQDVVATIEDLIIPGESTAYLIFGDSNYKLDSAGQETLELLLSETGSPEDEGLLDPVDENNPETNGYIIDNDGRITTPFTDEVIAEAGEWQYRENSDQYILTATGQPLEMADIYYSSFGG